MHHALHRNVSSVHEWSKFGSDSSRYVANLRPADVFDFDSIPDAQQVSL